MQGKNSLNDIPVIVEASKTDLRLHWRRRMFQISTIIIAVLIPLSGLFRIDPIAGAFVILDRQIWWSDFNLVFGFWLLVASGLVLMYSTVGTAFCGWSCPQNTVSEWANHLTRKLLGKRADIRLDGGKMAVVSTKNRLINWAVLGMAFLSAALFFALIPLLYFYTPDAIWSFVTFRQDEQLAASLHYIYAVFVLVIFLDIAFIRHFWCRFMCVYKVWQHGFKTRQTLHIHYDSSRKAECEKCNYCVTSCFIQLDPRKTDVYDTCINCGECVTACNNLQAKKGEKGLLSFRIGSREASSHALLLTRLADLSARVRWTIPFSILGLIMFAFGMYRYEYYHLAVYRADTLQGAQINDYRIAVSNKLYRPASLSVEVKGLPQNSYTLSSQTVILDSVGRIDLNLHVNDNLPGGLHSFVVNAAADNGWSADFRVQHFVSRRM